MLTKMTYINHIGQAILFGVGGIAVSENDIRDYEWNYNTQYDKITRFDRRITKKTLPVTIYGNDAYEKANHLYDVLDRDIAYNKAGTLYMGVASENSAELHNAFSMKGYFFASTKPRTAYQGIVTLELQFVSDEPFWTREKVSAYRSTNRIGSDDTGNDYPYDYTYDMTQDLTFYQLINENYIPADFRMTIYESQNPTVYIENHTYRVNVEVYENEMLVIDSALKKIYKVLEDGDVQNCFESRDKESYIFEQIPTGESTVSTETEFDFDIVVIEKRSEPKWN